MHSSNLFDGFDSQFPTSRKVDRAKLKSLDVDSGLLPACFVLWARCLPFLSFLPGFLEGSIRPWVEDQALFRK
jgi:hypothetical protein